MRSNQYLSSTEYNRILVLMDVRKFHNIPQSPAVQWYRFTSSLKVGNATTLIVPSRSPYNH